MTAPADTLTELLAEFQAWKTEADHISNNTGPYTHRDSTEDERFENDDQGLTLLRRLGDWATQVGTPQPELVNWVANGLGKRDFTVVPVGRYEHSRVAVAALTLVKAYRPPTPPK